jgi:AcrR family transcriptional regulator
MESALIPPAQSWLLFLSGRTLSLLIAAGGLAVFGYLIAMRLIPLLRAAPDPRFDRIPERLRRVLALWLLQWRQPRYLLAGVLHIVLFAGFLCLAVRSAQMVVLGMAEGFARRGL